MVMLAVVMAQAAAALSLSQVREMPPSAAGNEILGDLPHGEIESFKSFTGGMLPPDRIEGQLAERPNLLGSVCVRKVWTVLFRAAPGADIGTAKPETKRDKQEIAVPISGACPAGQYAYLDRSISIQQGNTALTKVSELSAPRSNAHLTCSDGTSSGLCAGDKAVRAALRAMKPWLVTKDGNEVLLGVPGGVVTSVSFDTADNAVRVKRFIAAPF